MKEKKFTPLMWCHLIVMAILMLTSIFVAIVYLAGTATPDFKTYYQEWAAPIYLFACFNIVNVLAMGSGIIYLARGYSKKAATFYKTFMLLTALSNVLLFVVTILSPNSGVAAGFIVIKIVILLALAFGKDMGKQRSWILFAVLVVLDLAFAFFVPRVDGTTFYRFSTVLSRLFIDGTIGLAIKGKYDDKDARGTV